MAKKSITIDPENFDTLYWTSRFYATIGNAKLAAPLIEKAISIAPFKFIISTFCIFVAKKAFAENRPLKAVALEMCDLSEEELDKALDPSKMTRGGFVD